MSKKLSIKIIMFLSVLICSFAFFDITTFASSEDQKVYDNASILTEDEVDQLEDLCKSYGKKGKLDIVIVTINDSDAGDCDIYLENMYDSIGFGYDKTKGDTAMIIVDMYTREVSIQGYGKAETYISSSRGDIIRGKITSDLTNGNYYDAFSKYIKLSSKYMKINPNFSPNNVLFQWWFQVLIPLLIGLITVSIMAFQSGGKITTNNSTYLDHNNANIKARRDDYIRTTITKVPKPKSDDNNNSGGGGGTSSGGSSHSTSRGSF